MIGICNAGSTVFDASQYAFFGNDVVQEVELGGLEDEEDDVPQAGFDEGDRDRDEVFCKWNLIFSCLTCMFAVFINTSLFKNSSRSHLICKIGKLTHFFGRVRLWELHQKLMILRAHFQRFVLQLFHIFTFL